MARLRLVCAKKTGARLKGGGGESDSRRWKVAKTRRWSWLLVSSWLAPSVNSPKLSSSEGSRLHLAPSEGTPPPPADLAKL